MIGVERRKAHQAVYAVLRLQVTGGVIAVNGDGDALDTGLFTGGEVEHLGTEPRRSAQRRYMRISISAQSCDSVPPAPAWIVRMALRES